MNIMDLQSFLEGVWGWGKGKGARYGGKAPELHCRVPACREHVDLGAQGLFATSSTGPELIQTPCRWLSHVSI